MKTIYHRLGKLLPALCLFQAIALVSFSQVTYTAGNMQLTLSGTSTLHDWDMKSSQGSCKAVFEFNNVGQITGLSSLVFSTPVTALKSGKSSMDNNAYKALKTDASPLITYTMTSASVTPGDGNTTVVKCIGGLSIAGKVVSTDVVATCRVNGDKSIVVSGTKKLNMLDYKVAPPTFMMGAVKTGSGLVLNFNGLLRK